MTFLSRDEASVAQLRELTRMILDQLELWASAPRPRSDISPAELGRMVGALDPCPDDGVPFDRVLDEVGTAALQHGVRTFDPHCVAHLHSPTLLAAAAAELAIGVTNQSMDSYDQAPAATLVEDHLVRWLAATVGLPPGATGVLTAGGTASNLLGLLLARDHAPTSLGGRIVTSEAAHFSVRRAATVLGLGSQAVVGVATDDRGRLDLAALDAILARLDAEGRRTLAVVGTAGTTDLGAIDPLEALAQRARDRGAWFHVDAAVGSAFCLSDRLRPLVAGLEQADSITADLHKLWWQPIGASALLVRQPDRLAILREPSDYLDRPEDDDQGVLNLVGRSLDTSRRFDALKMLVSLRSTGRRRMAALLEHLVDTAAAVASEVEARPELELLAPPSSITVVFRWRPADRDLADETLDQANTAIQRRLFDTGQAVIGRTRHRGRVALKLTLVNPQATREDLAKLLDLVTATAPPAPSTSSNLAPKAPDSGAFGARFEDTATAPTPSEEAAQ